MPTQTCSLQRLATMLQPIPNSRYVVCTVGLQHGFIPTHERLDLCFGWFTMFAERHDATPQRIGIYFIKHRAAPAPWLRLSSCCRPRASVLSLAVVVSHRVGLVLPAAKPLHPCPVSPAACASTRATPYRIIVACTSHRACIRCRVGKCRKI